MATANTFSLMIVKLFKLCKLMFSSVFERGMKCFDSYSARCLQNRKLSLFKNNVEGARKFFNKFCSDEDFQRGEREK